MDDMEYTMKIDKEDKYIVATLVVHNFIFYYFNFLIHLGI